MKRELILKQNLLIYDNQLQRFFQTNQAMASPVAVSSTEASAYREPQARAICDLYYGPGQWAHVTIRRATKHEQQRWAATLGGMAKSVAKTIAVRKNAKLARRRKNRP